MAVPWGVNTLKQPATVVDFAWPPLPSLARVSELISQTYFEIRMMSEIIQPSSFIYHLPSDVDWLRFHFITKVFRDEQQQFAAFEHMMEPSLCFHRLMFENMHNVYGIPGREDTLRMLCDAFEWIVTGSDIPDVRLV